MSLFQCGKCGCVENTSPGHYWSQKYGDGIENPLCSECKTGTWHGIFKKQTPTEDGHIALGDDGFLYLPEELEPGGYDYGRVKLVKIIGEE